MGAFSLHVFISACTRATRECMEKKMRSLFMHVRRSPRHIGLVD